MSEAPRPVLVYNRIEANRRKTGRLLASFALAMLPVLSAGAVFAMPWVTIFGVAIGYAIYGPALTAKLDSLQAEVTAARGAAETIDLTDLPASALLVVGALLAVALVVVVLALAVATAFLISRYGSRMVLRIAGARPIDAAREPELVRMVENLCIGAGLPRPSIFVVESTAPNAFATGRDPQNASLVVTRGLLTLLDRRELEGVIAHELSHIGNHDIRLSTTLAALVGTMNLPFRIVTGPWRFAFRVHWSLGILALWLGFPLILSLFMVVGFTLRMMASGELGLEIPPFLKVWYAHAVFAPFYAVFVAPIVALLIRQAVSREREFLADADAALLTRDPEGLALALVKIGAAGGERLRVGEGTVHLYFVDPSQERPSLMHTMFPSHPPLEERIALLARMGGGIAPSALQAAKEAGAKARRAQAETARPPAPPSDAPPEEAPSSAPAAQPRLTPLYEQPDGWSLVLAQLSPDAVVTPLGTEGNFIRVTTVDHGTGYISRLAPLAVRVLQQERDAVIGNA